ncbi:hypothetical protein GCM10018793_37310 [Streptomyces sulfonofaciens]|uniref:Response regulatory domain-containing protein n=1 Tax=Streptomyces sulfonofaciens TaxID=68272 RepID=A0A919L1Z0_9ACTN|nr:hypothetical protein GCM10018793_37310 [Streptomyces sulfonofaciens]
MDDNKVIRQLIRVNLELEGFEVVTAADGAECLDVVHQVQPDVITLDVVMPRLDGVRTAALLRSDPRTRSLPVVIVSGCTPQEAGVGPASGIDAFVAKPFEPAELVRTVRLLLERDAAVAIGPRTDLSDHLAEHGDPGERVDHCERSDLGDRSECGGAADPGRPELGGEVGDPGGRPGDIAGRPRGFTGRSGDGSGPRGLGDQLRPDGSADLPGQGGPVGRTGLGGGRSDLGGGAEETERAGWGRGF